ncbi:hypothetical protein IGI04_014502, partial [Brassica rapa subsp. trilocularis]
MELVTEAQCLQLIQRSNVTSGIRARLQYQDHRLKFSFGSVREARSSNQRIKQARRKIRSRLETYLVYLCVLFALKNLQDRSVALVDK